MTQFFEMDTFRGKWVSARFGLLAIFVHFSDLFIELDGVRREAESLSNPRLIIRSSTEAPQGQ